MELKPGDVIDKKFTIEKELGRGGMGVVYLARHHELGTHVALKFLRAALATDDQLTARFRNEARVGTRLKSHHVARVHDIARHADAYCIVMEHLTGSDLGKVLEERGPLSVAETADLLLEACEPIHEAHVLGIIHRDLKPTNLFVTDGPDGLKVLDFGISKSPYVEGAVRTGTYAVAGSAYYMSPEQLTSSRAVDARTDVWALGVILYQVLGDTVPFAGSSMVDVHEAIRNGTWTRLSEHCPGLPAAIDALVAGALERDRDRRIPSVLAFATRLAPFGGDRAKEALARMRRIGEVPAVEIRKTEEAPPLRSSRRWVGGAAFGVLGAAVVGGGLAVEGRFSPESIAPPSPTPAASASAPAELAVMAPVFSAAVPPVPAEPPPSASAVVAPSAPDPARKYAKPACAGGATPECEAACRANARGACETLAIALVHGRGASRDPRRAATIYQAVCDAGSLSACNALGALLADGDGVARDAERALGLYHRACEGHYARGCLNEGAMYFDGTGAEKNQKHGADLFRRACAGGEPLGCTNLGVAYRKGWGVEQSDERARECEAKAASARAP